MKRKNCKHKSTELRRTEIIQAALECFTETGLAAASIADICRKSNASVGSIYHHFKGKERLAAAVYLEGIRNYQTGFVAELQQHQEARNGILAVVKYHLLWVKNSTDWARYLFQNRHSEFLADMEPEFKELNETFVAGVAGWFRKHMEEGTLRKLPPDIFMSILLGPCQEMCRHMIAGSCRSDVDKAIHELGKAAWRALGLNPL